LIDENVRLIDGLAALGQEFSRGEHIPAYADLFKTMIDYAAHVDCNVLSFIWPQEMSQIRLCIITVNSQTGLVDQIHCYTPINTEIDTLEEVVLHHDLTHFTYLKSSLGEKVLVLNIRNFKIVYS
jgi:hypothetical protein